MKLKPPINTSTPQIDGWESLQSHLNPQGESQTENSQADSPRLDNDSNLDSLQLADSQLDNLIKCTLCNKPVLQASLGDHQATCPNSQNPAILKRRLSQETDSNPLEPKKSKITLHLNPSSSSFSSSTAPSDPLAPSTTSLPNSTKPSPSPLPSTTALPVQLPIPSTSSAPAPDATQKKPKRVVDPDRQCCVINERGLPCQRSLTCKTHNMSSKRAVPHRSVSFDILLLEWQKASRIGKEREALSKGLRGGDTVMDESKEKVGKKKRGSLVEGLQGSPLSGDSTTLLPTHSPSSTSLKKSKKPSTSTSLPLFTRVGEAPSRTASDEEGNQEQGFEESSDYLSSSDEVESVLLSIRKLPRGQALGGIREGGGSGWGAAGWWTGRNRKLARLRGSIGGNSFGGVGGEGQGQGGGGGGIFGSGNLQGAGNSRR